MAAFCFLFGLNMTFQLSEYTPPNESHSLKPPALSSSQTKPKKSQVTRVVTSGEAITDKGKPLSSAVAGFLQESRKKEQNPEPTHRVLFAGSNEPGMEEAASDPLRASSFAVRRGSPIDIQPATPHLGVLLDAGRHYFPIFWIKRLLDRLHDLNYNLLHFRLTDDQTFNVLLKSHPELAYPTAVNNPDRLVYSVQELKELAAYAQERGIRIMPEVNLPGHAGAWAGGRPDLVVHCPKFLCNKGYGAALNVTHPDLPDMLSNILTELIDIFDPPFLHLGGDEVNMAAPCFQQLGIPMFDYQAFEQLLKGIIQKVGYPEDKVVRWEMTGQKTLERAGGMEHFWESHPGVRHEATGPFFVSTWLYFDTNKDQSAFDVYEKTRKSFELKGGKLPTAIIAGTFELSTEFWYDRNVLGKLLAVAMGASNDKFYSPQTALRKAEILRQWKSYCDQLGFGPKICGTTGVGVIPFKEYRKKWEAKWRIWKTDLCDRLATSKDGRGFPNRDRERNRSYQLGTNYFWQNFPLDQTGNVPAVKEHQPDYSSRMGISPGKECRAPCWCHSGRD